MWELMAPVAPLLGAHLRLGPTTYGYLLDLRDILKKNSTKSSSRTIQLANAHLARGGFAKSCILAWTSVITIFSDKGTQ